MGVLPTSEPRTIAIFDFDGTLAEHDSLWPFLVAVAGLPRCMLAMCVSLWAYIFACQGDKRTIVKERLLYAILRGRRHSELAPAITRMKSWPRWMKTAEDLKRHYAAGHHVVIATGSLDLYIKEMLGDLPYHAILSTEMEVQGGVLTGRMALGNCVRQRKAERVEAYMLSHGPYEDSWAYGNAPHDLPMMKLTKHSVVI